jgi:hypothetical protein
MKFDPKIRKAIYAAVAGIVPLLVLAGFITDEQSQAVMSSVAALLSFLATILAASNTQVNNPQGDFEDAELEDFTVIEIPEIPGQK